MYYIETLSGQITSSHFAAYELTSNGASKNYQGHTMGRFEFLPGVEREGCPVYRQAQSREVPSDFDCFLSRWEKCFFVFLLSRSGNEWLVEDERYVANLKASVGKDPLIPPTTGWKFLDSDTGTYEEDPQLTCSSTPSSSPCSVRVSLSGLAKEIQGECEGEYKDAGLRSTGRKVINFSISSSDHFDLLSGVQT